MPRRGPELVGIAIFLAGVVAAGVVDHSSVTDSSVPLSTLQQLAPLISGVMMLTGAIWYVVCRRKARQDLKQSTT